jgi:hypothetical protein
MTHISSATTRTVLVRLAHDSRRMTARVLASLSVLVSVLAVAGLAAILPAGTPATGAELAPYGGCAEAWQSPRSAGADWCRARGWEITGRFVISPRAIVAHESLPHCRYEDGSGQASACTWNLGPRIDGNGVGLAYIVRRDDTARYVWPSNPRVDSWYWVTRSAALTVHLRHDYPRRTSWRECVGRTRFVSGDFVVKCPNGFRRVVS